MKKITTINSGVIPLMRDNIDTDQIIPKQFLKNILKSGYGRNLFYDWRYKATSKEANPDFILNKPEYKQAQILVTGENFGCGSSREHAVWALKDYGFQVVIAGSYSDIFYMNSTKNGLLAIELPKKIEQSWLQFQLKKKSLLIFQGNRYDMKSISLIFQLIRFGNTNSSMASMTSRSQ